MDGHRELEQGGISFLWASGGLRVLPLQIGSRCSDRFDGQSPAALRMMWKSGRRHEVGCKSWCWKICCGHVDAEFWVKL